MTQNTSFWRPCSSCKKPISYSAKFYECNVSTCTGLRTGYVFCSVPCWETHVPQARHRDAWAVEKIAPSFAQASSATSTVAADAPQSPGVRRIIASPSTPAPKPPQEILVVVSKLKQYVKDKADMNTSADVADILSDHLRRACDEAIDHARAEGRKTLMARDFKS